MTETTLREHQSKAGSSRSEKKIQAARENLKRAWAARKVANPSPYQRQRRANKKRSNAHDNQTGS